MSWPAHRTPRYLLNRLREWLYQKRHPEAPWLGPKAVAVLESLLKPHMQGIEFGAGRSTTWIAPRVAQLESWEESAQWQQQVAQKLAASGLRNVTLNKVETTGDKNNWQAAYAQVLQNITDRLFDFVLVDADHAREMLCRQLISQIKPGGFLMLDNANWFLPSGSHSPHSRTLSQGPASAGWQPFLEAVADWECIWTSSGVTDTAFWICPLAK